MTAADVVVVGAGAAGLFAAIHAAERGGRVLLLEKKDRPGLKILISGGGRCNLTTTRHGRDLEAQYEPRRARWLRHALRAFPPRALCQWVEAAGVPLQEEDLDKIFPVSGRAKDVLGALLRRAEALGVELRTEAPMLELERCAAGGFAVTTPQGVLTAPAVILAVGGKSYPRTGTTGDGYGVCRALGHRIVAPVPALAPLAVDVDWVHRLAGIVLDASVTVRDGAGRALCRRRRPVLFTHRGLSGPGPMDLSGYIEERGGGCTVALDLVPDLAPEAVRRGLMEAARSHGKRSAKSALPDALPERLRAALVELADADVALAELRRDRREALARLVKDASLPVERSLGFAHAEVTRGGVELEEVDPRTMQSRLVPGLYLCGELLDVDGPIGGFNFQAAFATGRLAGLAVGAPPAARDQ
ncbi:MAG: NAD(P)/FAD-dependent oxidoreductase [Planctomycetota bacterium]